MLVRELIAFLENCDQDALVVMSADGEGNRFDTLYEIDDDALYVPDGYDSFVVPRSISEQEDEGYDDKYEDGVDDVTKCIVLWP